MDADVLAQREAAKPDRVAKERVGMGREFFGALRLNMTGAEQGAACVFTKG